MTGGDFAGWQLACRARFDRALDTALPPADTYPARLHAAMRASGALKRDVAFAACVDTALAEKVVHATPA